MADDDAVVEALGRTKLFGAFPDKELRKVQQAGKEISFAAGADVTTKGEAGGRFFLILEGEADVVLGGAAAASRRIGPGETFGEIALLDGGPRTATVVAVSPLRTFSLASWNFRPLVLEHPELATAVIATLCAWLREAGAGGGTAAGGPSSPAS